jgi:type II secretory pathway pseudopilin PulG
MPSPPTPPHRSRQSGFSLIEGLIAAALMLMVVIGILPLFTAAMRSNFVGETTMVATNTARSSFEDYLNRDFNDIAMTVPAGAASLVTQDFWASSVDGLGKPTEPYYWQAAPASTARVTWSRTATTRQFNIAPTDGSDPLEVIPMHGAAPLAGGTAASFVLLKEVEVLVENQAVDLNSGAVSPLGGSWGQRVRIYKAF